MLAALFAAGTVVTTLNTYGLPLLDPSKLDLSPETVAAALPGTLAFFALLGEILTVSPHLVDSHVMHFMWVHNQLRPSLCTASHNNMIWLTARTHGAGY